jgi:hypothetical protein
MIFITQYLCPKRHCILAAAHEKAECADAVEKIKAAVAVLKLNPWCGICGSTELGFETRATCFTTMEEAAPVLTELAYGNLRAMELFAKAPTLN